jgi:hypothetical protein
MSEAPNTNPEMRDEDYIPEEDFVHILDHLEGHLRELRRENNPLYMNLSPSVRERAISYLEAEIASIYEEDWSNYSVEALSARSHAIINELADKAGYSGLKKELDG